MLLILIILDNCFSYKTIKRRVSAKSFEYDFSGRDCPM